MRETFSPARTDPREHLRRLPDEALLRAIATDADRAAFAELFARYAPKLLAYFLRRPCKRAEAEDLVQDAMLRVWAHASVYRTELSAPSTWIFRIARHRQIDVLRRYKSFENVDLGLLEDIDATTAEERLEWHQLGEHVLHALDQLPAAQAEVVRASYYHHESAAQLSVRLAIPLGTVKSRLAHALIRLRENSTRNNLWAHSTETTRRL